MTSLSPTIISPPEGGREPGSRGLAMSSAPASLMAVVREDPFDPRPPQLVSVQPGETLAALVDRLGFDPIVRPLAVAVIDGEEVPEADWADWRVKHGQHVAICIAPQGGGDSGDKLLTTVLTIFVMVAAFWVSGGALAPLLGSSFEAGALGANIAAAAVSAVGSLAVSALVKPPSAPAQDRINPVYSVDGATNRFVPFEPIILSVGERRVFPRQVARGYQEIVGDDFYYRMVLEWGPIGIDLSDIKVGDTPISAIDDVEMEHRLVDSDPHPTMYPAQVFQEQVGAALDSLSDWESRRTIADADRVSVIIGFPTGLGHTSKKGKSEQWACQIEIRYRTVTGDPGSEIYGSWQSPPGNAVSWPTRGGVYPGTGKYGFSEKKRNQPFFRSVGFTLPAAGTYDIEVRRSSPNADPEVDRHYDDMVWQVLESRRPGQPVTREDVAYSVMRFKGTDETQGRIQTINGMVSRLIPRFNAGFLASGDLSTASVSSLGAAVASSNPWEIILWLYRNGFEGRTPVSDAAISWPSFAAAAKNANTNGWSFDHVFDGAATISEAVETIAFAACGRVAFIGNKLTAIVDAPQLAPVAVISDRKARNVRAVKRLTRPPDGFRITYDDAADGYRTREVRVYVNGKTAETASRFEEIRIPGVVHWTAVHRLVARNYRNSRLQARILTAEVSVHDVDTAIQLGAWVGIQTKVVEVGRASGWIRAIETDGSGDVIGVTLDQPVEQTAGDDLVLQWSRQMGPGVSETLSNALPVGDPGSTVIHEQIVLDPPATGADKPQVGDAYIFGVSGFLRLDGLVDDIEAVDHDWLRLTLVDYAPARFDETGLVIPPYAPAFERPAFIRPPSLEIVSVARDLDYIVVHFRPVPGDRGQSNYFLASRAIAPDSEDTAVGAWESLPDLAATDRQLVAPAGQAGDAWIYRIAAVGPNEEVGPYLYIGPVEAIAVLPDPVNVSAVPSVETTAAGGERAILTVQADPVEDVQVEHMVVDVRQVLLDGSGDRLDEELQPDFEQQAVVDADVSRTIIRGLPAGARLDIEVYFRGARQELSLRYRIEDVILPTNDVAGSAGVAVGIQGQDWDGYKFKTQADNRQAAFAPRIAWGFKNSAEGWSGRGAAGNLFQWNANKYVVSYAGGSNTTYIVSPVFSLSGKEIPVIRARIIRTDDSPADGWAGQMLYQTEGGHGFTFAFQATAIETPTAAEDKWFIAEWDMSQLDVGGSDYLDSIISRIRMGFSNSVNEVWSIDWVAMGTRSTDPVGSRGILDYADETGINIADGFDGQGGLATKDEVGTNDILTGAVNELEASSDESVVSQTANDTWFTVFSETITTTGKPVLVMPSFSFTLVDGGNLSSLDAWVRIKRNAAIIRPDTPIGRAFYNSGTNKSYCLNSYAGVDVDSPPADTWTYTVDVKWTGASGGVVEIGNVHNRGLALVEFKNA